MRCRAHAGERPAYTARASCRSARAIHGSERHRTASGEADEDHLQPSPPALRTRRHEVQRRRDRPAVRREIAGSLEVQILILTGSGRPRASLRLRIADVSHRGGEPARPDSSDVTVTRRFGPIRSARSTPPSHACLAAHVRFTDTSVHRAGPSTLPPLHPRSHQRQRLRSRIRSVQGVKGAGMAITSLAYGSLHE